MKPVRFLSISKQEMINSAIFYETQARGLGNDFLDKIDNAVDDVSKNPDRWPIINKNIRRRLVQRFPYCILYRIDSEEIVILAVMHLRRRPDYWVERI